jgi:hypothetical protein
MCWSYTGYAGSAALCLRVIHSSAAASLDSQSGLGNNRDRPVIVAVIAVWVVQATIYQIIVVIAVRYPLVPTLGMPTLAGNRLAFGGVGVADSNHMLIVVPLVGVVQVPIVQVIYVPVVLNAGVPTVRAVGVGVVGVDGAAHLGLSFLILPNNLRVRRRQSAALLVA